MHQLSLKYFLTASKPSPQTDIGGFWIGLPSTEDIKFRSLSFQSSCPISQTSLGNVLSLLNPNHRVLRCSSLLRDTGTVLSSLFISKRVAKQTSFSMALGTVSSELLLISKKTRFFKFKSTPGNCLNLLLFKWRDLKLFRFFIESGKWLMELLEHVKISRFRNEDPDRMKSLQY